MHKPYHIIVFLILSALWLAGCSSPVSAKPPSTMMGFRENTGSEVRQSLNSTAANVATGGKTEWAARATFAAPSVPTPPAVEKIRVGIKRLEPFVFIDENEQLSGFSVDLWNAIAADLEIQYEWVPENTVNELIRDVRLGKTEAGISAISMTPQRESLVDFTYPYFESGLQIMVRVTSEPFGANLLDIFFPSILFNMLGLGILLLIVLGHLIWLVEARVNPDMPKSYRAGVWDGMWWGLKILVAQEYMDTRKPNSVLNRLFVMIWMIFGVVLIAEFTAAITTSQTVSQLRPTIESLSDLHGKRVLTVDGSTAEEFLFAQEVHHSTGENIADAYDALMDDQADAIVFDAPVLLFYAQNQGYGLVEVVGTIYQEENYGIALPIGSPLRKPVNSALLRLRNSGRYDEIYEKWFGSKE